MKEKIRLLQTEIQADLQTIEQAYKSINAVEKNRFGPETDVVIGYYLHVIYGLFENLFTRIAIVFENQITDKSRWHKELLWRMTLDVKEVRPPVIRKETYDCFDELRRFRHLFRNAYLLNFDPDRLALVLKKARQLETLYPEDITKFLFFLDTLVE